MIYIIWCYECGTQERWQTTSPNAVYEAMGQNGGRSLCCGAFTDAVRVFA